MSALKQDTAGSPYRVPPEPKRWPAIGLAVGVHALLLAFLWIGVSWQNNTPVAVEAEVWDMQTQTAAPPPPQPTAEPEPEPEPQPDTPPPAPAPMPRAVEPPPPPVAKPVQQKEAAKAPAKEPDIALEREKKRKEELKRKEQQAEEERQERERQLAQERAEQKRADEKKAKALAEKQERQQEREREEKARKLADQKAQDAADKKEREAAEKKAEQLAKQEQAKKEEAEKKKKADKEKAEKLAKEKAAKEKAAEAAQLAKLANMSREAETRRITGSGNAGSTGTAEKSPAPRSDPGYQAAISAKIKSNANYAGSTDVPGNPTVSFRVEQLPTGEIVSVKKVKSSGIPEFDDAVERSINKSSPLPKKKDGTVERSLSVNFHMKDLN